MYIQIHICIYISLSDQTKQMPISNNVQCMNQVTAGELPREENLSQYSIPKELQEHHFILLSTLSLPMSTCGKNDCPSTKNSTDKERIN